MAPAPLSCMVRPVVMSIGHVLNADVAPAPTFSFTRLPCEVIQEVATYLSDKDLASFSLAEKGTCNAVIPVNAGHWRVRFKEQFDMGIQLCSATLVMDYKLRKRFLSPQIYFKLGHSPNEASCLAVIRQLVNESLGCVGGRGSNNCRQLWRFMKKSNFLFDAFRWAHATRDIEYQVDPLLMTLQVFFFTWNLSRTVDDASTDAYPLSLRRSAYHIDWSQATVLAVPKFPLVDRHGRINMGLLYHLTNFWRFHLTLNDAGPLSYFWCELGPENQPLLWAPKLDQGDLGFCNHWKGAMYGRRTRSFKWKSFSNDDFFTGGDDPLELRIHRADPTVPWPEKFEKVVHALPMDSKDLAEFLDTEYPIGTMQKPSKKRGHLARSEKSIPRRSSAEAYQHSLTFPRIIEQGTDVLKCTMANHKLTTPTIQFIGFCDKFCGDRALNIAGIIHPLPAQSGVPEWSRITMVSYNTPPSGTAAKGFLDADERDLNIYMRYQGVICPGSSIMLGFYYQMGFEYDDGGEDLFMKHGPFIFWNAYDNATDQDFADQDADDENSDGDGDHSARSDPDDIDAPADDGSS
ncbi:MAG: hypothetical protein Q9211_003141 [Gyalolechia sp. 1 TL-2023]